MTEKLQEFNEYNWKGHRKIVKRTKNLQSKFRFGAMQKVWKILQISKHAEKCAYSRYRRRPFSLERALQSLKITGFSDRISRSYAETHAETQDCGIFSTPVLLVFFWIPCCDRDRLPITCRASCSWIFPEDLLPWFAYRMHSVLHTMAQFPYTDELVIFLTGQPHACTHKTWTTSELMCAFSRSLNILAQHALSLKQTAFLKLHRQNDFRVARRNSEEQSAVGSSDLEGIIRLIFLLLPYYCSSIRWVVFFCTSFLRPLGQLRNHFFFSP